MENMTSAQKMSKATQLQEKALKLFDKGSALAREAAFLEHEVHFAEGEPADLQDLLEWLREDRRGTDFVLRVHANGWFEIETNRRGNHLAVQRPSIGECIRMLRGRAGDQDAMHELKSLMASPDGARALLKAVKDAQCS